MKFTFTPLEIPGLIEIEHQSIGDARGFFAEIFREEVFRASGIPLPFLQENQSRSPRGVLRGLHYQIAPKAQGKLVRCAGGAIFDVAVDLRKGLKTFGRWIGRVLSEENRKMLYVPAGCAHGFLALSASADVLYKTTEYYSPEHERGIRWDDPELRIAWPEKPTQISPRDAAYPFLKDARL
ncbi:MAG: dTDP-4-dehydrorhamnose 3,5-epimerase [Elusimicrobia bacterium]|nr:dTDP-4-dehydrorhamnose 3,5-epimerase [Elusimicrobiota bacterium]